MLVFEEAAVPLLAGAHRRLRLLALGDVRGDTADSDDLPVRTLGVDWRLDLEIIAAAAVAQLHLNLLGALASLLHHPPVDRLEARDGFRTEKRRVVLAVQFLPRDAKKLERGPVGVGVPALPVLHVDAGVRQSVERQADAVELRLGSRRGQLRLPPFSQVDKAR